MAKDIVQILRRVQGTAGAPAETGRREGELFANLALGGTPELWVFGGPTGGAGPGNLGWLRVNPPASISVVSKTIPGTTLPWADGNGQATATGQWPWVVNQGEVPIVTHDGTAYAFTGGPGSWGTTSGGTTLTAGMFTALGAAAGDPEVYDWSSRAEADLGAAYAAASPTFGSGAVIVKWKDGQTYLLTNPKTPANSASYTPIATSKPTQKVAVLDWTGAPYAAAATIDAAYAVWAGTPGNVISAADVTLVKYAKPGGASDTYVVTDATAPTNAASYFLLHHPAEALAFTAAYDITAAYTAGNMQPANVGDFGLVSKTGVVAAGWPIEGVSAGDKLDQGTLLIWDGAKFVPLVNETDLSAYVPFSGGTMSDAASLTFDTTTAAGTAGGAASQVIIDGAGGSLENVVIDCGQI